jgi:3-oxoacyl-[acyl-carrier protein] reductase
VSDLPGAPKPLAWAVGDQRAIVHTFSENEVVAFADLTGDRNPLHVDESFARGTAAGGRVVHGMLAASLVSTLIGERLPGAGALWHAFNVNWRRMIRIGDTLRIEARVTAVQAATRSLELAICGVHVNSGETCLDGTAKVMIMAEQPTIERSTLAGKRALVTGASGEVGQAICRQLAADGCSLVMWGRNGDRLRQVADSLGAAASSSHNVELGDTGAIDSALDNVLGHGPVDILVHAASAPLGYLEFGADGYRAELRSHWAISAAAFGQIAERLLPRMPAGGAIVAVLTQAILDAPPAKMSAYVSGKLAAWGLVKSIAAEFGPKGIRCNALSPGLINSPLTRDLPVRVKQVEAAANPLRRLCTAQDVADAVAYLCGPRADFINGANLPVGGGARMP